MPSAHHRENVRTLRFRLTLWNTAIVFLFVLATLWGVREELRLFLWKEADEQLIEDAREVKETVEQVTLLPAPPGDYWLPGRATRPIARIIDTTARLHPSNLGERLPIRGTRDELDRLSATINGFLDRIGTYLEQNREFTANAAHE